MRDRRRKNSAQRGGRRRLLTLGLLGLGLCLLFLPTEIRILRMQSELQQLQRQERVLLQRQQEIKEKVRYYASDAYVEEAARRDLGLVKPGESLVVPAVPGNVQPPPKNHENQVYRD